MDIDKDLQKDYRGNFKFYQGTDELINSVAVVVDTLNGEVPRNYKIGNKIKLKLFEYIDAGFPGGIESDLERGLKDDPRLANVFVAVKDMNPTTREVELNIYLQRKGQRQVDTTHRRMREFAF